MSPPLTTYESLVSRTIELWKRFLLEHAPWGATAAPSRGTADAEVTVWLLQNITQGIAPPTITGDMKYVDLFRAARQIRVIAANKTEVTRMICSGISRMAGNTLEMVQPAPAHVIAGWLGAAPRDPQYLMRSPQPKPTSS
jgi:hypothetical protein